MCQCSDGACWLRVDDYDYQTGLKHLKAGNIRGHIILEAARLRNKASRMQTDQIERIDEGYCRDGRTFQTESERTAQVIAFTESVQ